MKIALISVAPPFRGGISKHTSILFEKLSKKHSIEIINYSRQYPSMLFPGKSQFLNINDSREYSNRLIDSINPLTWFKTGNFLAVNNYDLIIFRYWNPFFAPALNVIASIIKKKSKKTKLISLCDNIIPHEVIPFGNFLTKLFFKKMDGHLVQSSQAEQELLDLISKPIYEKRNHPLYSIFPEKIEKEKAKCKFNIKSKYVILYFGIIRDYKGFDVLLQSFSKIQNKNIYLLAAGECYGSAEKYYDLISELKIEDSITWKNEYINDNEVHYYFSAADIIVLPYRSASQSGIIPIAYSYDLPVIATNVGGLPEVIEDGRSGFIVSLDNPTELYEKINLALNEKKIYEMNIFIKTYKNNFSWGNFINGIEILYKRL